MTPLLSWARPVLKVSGGLVWDKTKQEKHWVTKSHLELFLNVVFILFISFCVATVFFCCMGFFPDDQQADSSSLRTHFPWFHGFTHFSHLSHGYLYISLPPVFMYLLPVVLTCRCCFFLLSFLFVLSNWPQPHRATSALPTCCCWREKYCFMWVDSKATNCSLVCMCAFVIEMYCKYKKADIFNKNINLSHELLAFLSPLGSFFSVRITWWNRHSLYLVCFCVVLSYEVEGPFLTLDGPWKVGEFGTAFWPTLCLPWFGHKNSPRPSCAHQPAWHHQIYFYSLQIEPSFYPYWHIPRLRGAWLRSRGTGI